MPFATKKIPDPRATHYWDGDGGLKSGFSPALGMPVIAGSPAPAWAIYMIFGPEAKWSATALPKPGLWMQKLPGLGLKAPFFYAGDFAEHAEKQLRLTMTASVPAEGGNASSLARSCG